MNIPYRTRRVLNRVGIVLLAILVVFVAVWLCWVIWLDRYVVYTDEGATIDFSLSSHELNGEVAVKPVAEGNISIYYNEGSDSINTTNELTKLSGYYIDSNMLQKDMANVLQLIENIPSGTAIMIELKAGYGSFYYPSNLSDAIQSASIDSTAVSDLITKLQSKGFYTIAKISAFRDYNFGLNHVSSGLYMLSRAGLWPDEGGCYWLDPTNSTTTNWISSIVLELRDMGFNEVVLGDFRFPNSEQYIFSGDKAAALQSAANTIYSTCSANNFTISFSVDDPTFTLPEGRCRLYLSGVDAKSAASVASKVTVPDSDSQLVFVAETNDTRFNDYGVLRSIAVSTVVEEQKK